MTRLLDSSAWIEFLKGSERGAHVCHFIEEGDAATSVVSLAEVGAKLDKEGQRPKAKLEFMQKESDILPVTKGVAAKAGPFKNRRRKSRKSFSTMDALIYLTAQERNLTLLTKDTDFKGLPGVEML